MRMNHAQTAFQQWRDAMLLQKKPGEIATCAGTSFRVDITFDGRKILVGEAAQMEALRDAA